MFISIIIFVSLLIFYEVAAQFYSLSNCDWKAGNRYCATPSLNWLTFCFDEMWNILMCHIDKNYLFILLDLANDSLVSI